MKIPMSWLNDYTDINGVSIFEIKLLTKQTK